MVVLVVSCYHPSAQPGIPCSDRLTCPGDQVCDTARVPPVCVDHLGDGVDAPISDIDAPAAARCTADSECGSDVCHELTGECVDEAAAIYVAPAGIDNGVCTRAQPCATIGAGVQQLSGTRTTVKIAAGAYTGGFQIRAKPGLVTAVISGPATGSDLVTVTASNAWSIDQVPTTIEGVSILTPNSDGISN